MLSKKIGIDMGTANVVVYVKGEGIVVNEPALVAFDAKGTRVLAVGLAANDLMDRGTPARVVRPLQDGNLVDAGVAGALLQHLIGRICGRQRIFRPDVMLSIPSRVTGVERRAILEATMQAGAKTAYLVEKLLAAALGASLPVGTSPGFAVCNLGAGITETAVIAGGEVLAQESVSVGGARMDAAIQARLQDRHGIAVGDQAVEALKIQLGGALPPPDSTSVEVSGTDPSGARRVVRVPVADVYEAIRGHLESVAAAVARVLEQAPVESRSHVRHSGLVLTGGGAQLKDLSAFLTRRIGIPARVAQNAQACVAIGTGLALENLEVLRRGRHYIT